MNKIYGASYKPFAGPVPISVMALTTISKAVAAVAHDRDFESGRSSRMYVYKLCRP